MGVPLPPWDVSSYGWIPSSSGHSVDSPKRESTSLSLSLFLSEMDAFPKLPIYPFSPLHEQGSHSHSQAFLPDVPLARRGVLKSLLRPHGMAQ